MAINDQELEQEVKDIVEACYKAPELVEYIVKISGDKTLKVDLENVSKKSIEEMILKLIKQDQVIREIDIRIDELNSIEIGGDNVWTVDNGSDTAMLISERIAELQAQKDKLIKGVE